MKKQLILLTLLLAGAAFTAQAQSKKDLEKDLKTANAKNDSIQKAYNELLAKTDTSKKGTTVTDSVNVVVVAITKDSAGTVVKTDTTVKVVTAAAAPATATAPTPNATFGISGTPSSTGDQIEALRAENERLKYIVNQYFGRGTIPAKPEDFGGLWALSLQYFKVTDDTSKSGLINVPAPPQSRVATQVIFIDFELAEITFSSGEAMKCFYKINSFSNTQPYSIDFTKGPELNVRLQVNPTSGSELQVSYKKGSGYYSGYMRKML